MILMLNKNNNFPIYGLLGLLISIIEIIKKKKKNE